MSSRYTGVVVEHTWNCPYCGKENRGRDRECNGCGRPRGKETKFDTSKHIATLSGEEAKKHMTGPDWFCECCDSYNPDTATECKGCGAPRGASKDYFRKRREQEEKEFAERMQQYDTDKDLAETERYLYGEKSQPMEKVKRAVKENSSTIAGIFGVIALLVTVIGLGIFFFKSKPVEGTVTEMAWSSSVSLEEFTTIRDEGWTHPSDARVLDKTWTYKETIQVIDHYDTEIQPVTKTRTVQDGVDTYYTYEDMGNGFSAQVEHTTPHYTTETYTDYETVQVPVYRDEDVYDWWYDYEYDRWLTIDTVTNSGDKGEESDPVFEIKDDRHRMSDYTRSYYMGVQTEEGLTTIIINVPVYNAADVGSHVKYNVNRAGMVVFTEIDGTQVEEEGRVSGG